MKNPNDFINTVAEMREAQRQYFRTRIPNFLHTSKQLEAKIDCMLEDHYKQRRQPELFTEE